MSVPRASEWLFATARALESRLVTVLSVLVALDLVLFFRYLESSFIQQPFSDMYSYVLRYLQTRESGAWWAYLWGQHDLHRPVWIRLLTAVDVEVFSGVAYPFVAAAVTCQLTTAYLLWRACRAGLPGELGQALSSVVVLLVLTSVAAVDCAIPIDTPYPLALAFGVLAILLFVGEDDVERAGRWTAGSRRVAALGAAVGAALGNAVGLVLWPILLWLAWRGRAGRVWMTTVAVCAMLFLAVYLRGLPVAADAGATLAGQSALSVDQLMTRANYLVTFLGLPWTRAEALSIPGRVLGAALFAGGVWAVWWRGLYRAPPGRLERTAVALIMFSLGAAVLATVGRTAGAGGDAVLVPVRYSVLLTPLHVGVLWLLAPALARFWRGPQGPSRLAMGLVGVCLLLLAQHVAVGEVAAATAGRMRTTIERFEAGHTDPEMLQIISSDLDQARRELEAMRRGGVYVRER